MKKRWMIPVFVLSLLLILSGCNKGGSSSEITGETEGIVFMETKVQEGEEGTLFYIPNKTPESMASPDLYLVQNNLLFAEQGEEEVCLKMISLEDGALIAETRLPVSGEVRLQMGEGLIALADHAGGTIFFLDLELEKVEEYKTEKEYLEFFLSSDMELLYLFEKNGSIVKRNRNTKEEQIILEQMEETEILGYNNYTVLFSYEDKGKQNMVLELDGDRLLHLPVSMDVKKGYKNGENYLLEDAGGKGRYTLITADYVKQMETEAGTMRYLGNQHQLLSIEEENHRLGLYDLNGKYVSGCHFEGEKELTLSEQFVFSGYRQGWYFIATTDEGSKLMFWDPFVETEGENLTFVKEEERESPYDMKLLKKRAKEMSEKYDVEILIGEDCTLDYTAYKAEALMDEQQISIALDTIDRCLSDYPKGLMKQLQYKNIEVLRFELVGRLKLKDGIDSRIDALGFAQEMLDHYLIVLQADFLLDSTVYHEITHILDSRVRWDAYERKDALFSEDEWMKLQPKGFAYAESYVDIPDSLKEFYDSGYFTRDYACTFSIEDIATMVEAAMIGDAYEFVENPGLNKKLDYFSKCIRDCFDTTGWPEQTKWEKILQK